MTSIQPRTAPGDAFQCFLRPRAGLLSIAIVVIILLVSFAANAVTVSVTAFVKVGLQETSQPQAFSDGEYINNAAALSTTQGFGSASSRGAPAFGGVSALIASDYSGLSQAQSKLSWEDNWLINPLDVTLIGRQARVHPVLELTGAGTAQSVVNAYARATWGLTARVGSTNTSIAGGVWDDTDGAGVTYTGDPVGQQIVGNGFLVPMGFATDIRFLLNASSRTECFGGCTGYRSASVDLSNTLNWVGLVVTDSDGQLIEDFTITSASGVDYTQPVDPVPEPQTLLLVSSGLVVISAGRRKKR